MTLLRNPEAVTSNHSNVVVETPTLEQEYVAAEHVPAFPSTSQDILVRPPTMPEPSSGDHGGLDNLKLDWRSFSRVVLKNGSFYSGSKDLGKSFVGKIVKTQDVWVINKDKNGQDAVWSYDGVNTTNNIPVAEVKKQWAADGFTNPITKPSQEVFALITEGELAGEMALISLSETNIPKLAGYHNTMLALKGKGANEVLTRFSVGPLISSGSNSWNPWVFGFAGDLG